jgi:hypothetical protein
MVDYKKILRDVIRGSLFDFDDVPLPAPGHVSPDDEHDLLCDFPSDEELQAFAELVREIRSEIINAGYVNYLESVKNLDEVLAKCALEQEGHGG